MDKLNGLLFLSDLHLVEENPKARIDNLKEKQWDKLDYCFDYAEKNKLMIVMAGDLFDKPRSFYLLNKFIQYANFYLDVPIITPYGQHDQYMRSIENTAFSVLKNLGMVESLFTTKEFTILTSNWDGVIPEPLMDTDLNILSIHAPIANTDENFETSKALLFLREHSDYDIILCGDIHKRFLVKDIDVRNKELHARYLLNTGPLVRKEATEYNFEFKPGFFVYNFGTKDITFTEIPNVEEGQLVLTRSHIDEKEVENEIIQEFVYELGETEISSSNAMDLISELIKANADLAYTIKRIIHNAGGANGIV